MPKAQEIAAITAGGQVYRDWKSVNVERVWGEEAISTFSVATTEPGSAGKGWRNLRLKPGDPVTVSLAGVQVINGNITARSTSLDAQGHEILVQGRSLAAKIVDSQVPIKPGTFDNMTYEQVARGLLAPHGVGLVVRNPPAIFGKPFRSLVPEYGERIMQMLDRMASMRGCFHSDDAQGNLVVGQGDPKAAPVAMIQEGVNLKSGSVRLVNENAWSKLTVASQHVGDDPTRPTRDYSASATNPNATEVRERLITAPHPGYADEMQAHANWNLAIDTWNEVQATLVVQGWFAPSGRLWDVTDNLSVLSPSLFPNADGHQILGVQTVRYSQDSEGGTITTLECVLPNALSPYQSTGVQTDQQGNTLGGAAVGTAQPNAPDTSS